jgi:3-hydroxyacyl-CoA dehydrogenase/enoyl-CoA hydratase/3-hydroxybutyryl-CoA epimerase
MPLGPLQLVDETSIDLGVKIAKATKAAMGDAYPDSPADTVLFRLHDLGRLGRKANAGFYAYDDKGKRERLWPDLRTHWPPQEQPRLTEVQHRLAMIQALEAVRALEDGVLTDIREGDVGAILGWGFMPWSGGPFAWLDMLGAARAVEMCETLAAAHGPRFAPPALLRDLAAKGESFYGRFMPADAAA